MKKFTLNGGVKFVNAECVEKELIDAGWTEVKEEKPKPKKRKKKED